jgi:hypothetical protein
LGCHSRPWFLNRLSNSFFAIVDRDRWRLLLLELLAQGSDMPKLLIAVGMGKAFQRFLNLE